MAQRRAIRVFRDPRRVAVDFEKLSAEFRAAHKDGMKALLRGDLAAFSDAIDRQWAIFKEWDAGINTAASACE